MKKQVAHKSVTKLRRQSAVVSALLKQLAHPQRLLILCALSEGELSVGSIEEACGASQSSVSQFLKSMRLEGLIEPRRDGKKVFYRIVDQQLQDLMKALFQIFCK